MRLSLRVVRHRPVHGIFCDGLVGERSGAGKVREYQRLSQGGVGA